MATGWGRRIGTRRSFRSPMTYEDFVPPSGWTEDSECHSLLIDLPGFKMEELKLEVDKKTGYITVGGERKVDENTNKYKRFKLQVNVPANSDIANITAKFEGEMFHVVVPKEVTILEKKEREIDQNEVKKEDENKNSNNGESEQNNSSNGVAERKNLRNGVVERKDSKNGEAEPKSSSNGDAERKNSSNNEAEGKDLSNNETEEKISNNSLTEEKNSINSETEQKISDNGEAENKNSTNSEIEQRGLNNDEAKCNNPNITETDEKISNHKEVEHKYSCNNEDNLSKSDCGEHKNGHTEKKEEIDTDAKKVHFHEERNEKGEEKANQLQCVMKKIDEHKGCIVAAILAFALGLFASRSRIN